MTLKTPLPSKLELQYSIDHYDVVRQLNQLIDHVKELGERVDSEELLAFECNDCGFGKLCNKHSIYSVPDQETLSLKETLLGEIRKLKEDMHRNLYSKVYYTEDNSYSVKWVDIADIINKLLP